MFVYFIQHGMIIRQSYFISERLIHAHFLPKKSEVLSLFCAYKAVYSICSWIDQMSKFLYK